MSKIAQDIKATYNYIEAYEVMEERAVDVDQDWKNMTTTYFFGDDSVIVIDTDGYVE